jgi:hypothetical protein
MIKINISGALGWVKNMAKKKTAAKKVGPLAALLQREKAETARAPLVNEFAAQHGDYDRNLRKVVNRGGTPIARWRTAGHLSDSQDAAIAHCIVLWDIISSSSGLVANLDRTVFGTPGDGHPREVEARSDLLRMKNHVGAKYWDVFENVVRFDEPAGVAGSRIGTPPQKAEYTARLIVQFVADIVTLRERLTY